jgi:N-acetylneuraminic acid mutarotase
MATGGGSDLETLTWTFSLSSDDNNSLDEMELDFSPKELQHCWKQLQSCEEFVGTKRSKHTMVAWDDRMYVFGGDNGKRMLNDFLVSRISDSSWARVVYTGTPPAPRYHHSAVVYSNSMFIFGGYTGDINSNSNLRNKNDLHEYCFITSQWIDWTDKITGRLPPARSAHGAAVYDGKLWIYAGYDGNTRLNDMWTIDLNSSSPIWIEINQSGDSPPTCCNFPVAVVRGKMYMFSGQSGAKITNNMYQFNFDDKVWTKIPTEHLLRGDSTPPQRRYGHTMVPYRDHLYVFGGACDGILDNEIHCFNVESCNWSIIVPLEESQIPTGRVFHTAAVCGDSMYIFGGTVDSIANRSGELYSFKFSSFPSCTLTNDFAKLLHTMPMSDVHFIVGNEREPVSAHAVVVAARSPFIRRKILEAYQTEAPSTDPPFLPSQPVEVIITEVSIATFTHAIYYMYTDRLIHPSSDLHSDSANQVLLMIDLYKFSLLLETRRLELLCMQYLEASVNENNVLLVLETASELNLSRLKEYCMKFVIRESNYRKVIMSSSFEGIDQSLMVQIVRRQLLRSRPTSPDPEPDHLTLPSTLQDDMKTFLLSDSGKPFADIILKVGKETILAHKPVLLARCSYFEALFRSFMPANLQVDIAFGKNVPSTCSFHSFLKYVYYGEVEGIPPEDALYVFSAPNFFGFSNSRLHSCCKAIIEQNVCLENVVPLLEVSDLISVTEMKEHCLELIAQHFPLLIHRHDFRNLTKPLLLDVLEALSQAKSK